MTNLFTEKSSPTRVTIAGICAVILTVGIARFSYTPLLPVMREQAGLGPIAAGWLATINYVGYLGGALLAASIKTLERKWVLYRVGLVVAVLSTLAMGVTKEVQIWLFLRFVAGWASTAGMLLGAGLVLNWLIRNGSRAELGIHFGGFGLGMTLSGLAAIAMEGQLTWDYQWYVLGVFGVLFLIPAWFWLPAPPSADKMKISNQAELPSKGWMKLFSIAYFCGGIGYVITTTFIIDIIRNMPEGAIPGNWVWVVMGIVAVPSCLTWDRVSGKIGQVRALTLAYALQTASFALIAYGTGPLAILTGAVLFGATVIGTVSLTLSIAGTMYPHNPAKAMARLTISYGLAQILGPIVAACMAGTEGNFHNSLVLAAIIGTAGTLLSMGCSLKRR